MGALVSAFVKSVLPQLGVLSLLPDMFFFSQYPIGPCAGLQQLVNVAISDNERT